ncbi:hypothetical protein MBLNU230_g5339t1 [Neophaeotheca triangularis]
MPLALAMTIPFVSGEKEAKTLDLFRDIAAHTLEHEHQNKSYCWLPKATDNTLDGPHVFGLEVYEQETDLTETHRSGEQYKKMRQIVPRDNLFERPPSLTLMEPATLTWWLVRDDETNILSASSSKDIMVTTSYEVTEGNAPKLLEALEKYAAQGQHDEALLTCLPLASREGGSTEMVLVERIRTPSLRPTANIALEVLSPSLRYCKLSASQCASRVSVQSWAGGFGHLRGYGCSSDTDSSE